MESRRKKDLEPDLLTGAVCMLYLEHTREGIPILSDLLQYD